MHTLQKAMPKPVKFQCGQRWRWTRRRGRGEFPPPPRRIIRGTWCRLCFTVHFFFHVEKPAVLQEGSHAALPGFCLTANQVKLGQNPNQWICLKSSALYVNLLSTACCNHYLRKITFTIKLSYCFLFLSPCLLIYASIYTHLPTSLVYTDIRMHEFTHLQYKERYNEWIRPYTQDSRYSTCIIKQGVSVTVLCRV